MKVNVPANIIVKQSITFMDGKTIVLFYKKAGNDCKVYSNDNLNNYGMSDIMRIKSTIMTKKKKYTILGIVLVISNCANLIL